MLKCSNAGHNGTKRSICFRYKRHFSSITSAQYSSVRDGLLHGADLQLPLLPGPLLLVLPPLLPPSLRPHSAQPGLGHFQDPSGRAQRLLQSLPQAAGGALLPPPLPPGGQRSDPPGSPGLCLHGPGSTFRGLGPGAAGDSPGPGHRGPPGGQDCLAGPGPHWKSHKNKQNARHESYQSRGRIKD